MKLMNLFKKKAFHAQGGVKVEEVAERVLLFMYFTRKTKRGGS